jgi:hypothetical protein
MQWIYLASFVVSLSACGPDNSNEFRSPIIDGDPILVEYVTRFVQDADSVGRTVKLRDLTVVFGVTATPDAPKRIGYCFQNSAGLRQIVIEDKFFYEASDEDKEGLLYHELGHCLLNLPHDERCRVRNGNVCIEPYSLMYPAYLKNVYGPNKPWYIQELFSKGA